jgi:hypothetical protein
VEFVIFSINQFFKGFKMANEYFVKTARGEVFKTLHPEYHKECEVMPHAEGKRVYTEQIKAGLKKSLKNGTRVYTSIRSVSKSGMSRTMRVYIVGKDKQISNITYSVSQVLGWTLTNEGVRVGGCGMDMGFHLVYSLSRTLYPKGNKANKDGGYILKHEWI